MFLTAPYMQGKESGIAQMQRVVTVENAVNSVNYWADQGFTSFKAYNQIEKHILKAAIDAAHKRGLKVTGHLCSVTYREAAEIGIDHLEHGFYRSNDFVPNKQPNVCPPDQGIGTNAKLDIHSDAVKSLMQLLISKKISLTSTLPNYESATTTQPVPNPEVLEMLCSDQRDAYLKRYFAVKSLKSPSRNDSAFMNTAKMEKIFYEMGGLLGVGTDPTGSGGNIAGYGNWRAIELLVVAGSFTPLEALKIATLNGAIALGIDKITGIIDAGKEADLIVIDGDPSKNISDIRKVVWVFKDGVGFNSKRMFESVKGKVGYY
jgi:imidazolonepropionase-like amidohydrolase